MVLGCNNLFMLGIIEMDIRLSTSIRIFLVLSQHNRQFIQLINHKNYKLISINNNIPKIISHIH